MTNPHQPHLIYGWQMNAWQALAILRRRGALSEQQDQEICRVIESGVEDAQIPAHLAPLAEQMYLLQVMPANKLLV